MESFDVPDSTDWLGTPLAGLMQVEQAFRCHVCKDFYDSPMITSCCHTFCSLCIRRSLATDGKCPLCRAVDQENKLRGNWSLREAVDKFVQTRDAVLEVARTRTQPPASSLSPAGAALSPKRKAADVEIEDDEEAGGRKRLRMSTRRSKAKSAEATAAIMREEASFEEATSRDGADYEPDDGLVACPICWKRMKPLQVDKHLDTSCLGVPQPSTTNTAVNTNGTSSGSRTIFQATGTTTTTTAPQKALERLPPLNYSMLNDQALRKKLTGLGISTSGSRQLLEKRHKEWVTLWNANCDSARPKKRSELVQDLNVWERTVGAPAPSRSSAIGAQIKDKDFDGEAWAVKHDSSFKDLIANARKSRLKAGASSGSASETAVEMEVEGSSAALGGNDAMPAQAEAAPPHPTPQSSHPPVAETTARNLESTATFIDLTKSGSVPETPPGRSQRSSRTEAKVATADAALLPQATEFQNL